jgi:hypothetical protein
VEVKGVLLALVGALALATSPARAADTESFDAVYKKAKKAYAKRDYAEAAGLLKRAYELRPAPALLWNLARTYEEAKQYEAALLAYREYVNQEVTDTDREAGRERIQAMKVAFGKGWLTVRSPTPEARVKIDDREPRPAPIERELLDLGRHTIELSAPGRPALRTSVKVEAGEDVELSLELAAAVDVDRLPEWQEPRPPPDGAGTTEAAGPSGLAIGGWVAVGLGVAVLAVGGGVLGVARAAASDFEASTLAPDGVNDATTRADALSLQASIKAQSDAGVGVLVAGGAVAFAGATLLILDAAGVGAERTGLWVAPTAGGGLVFGGKF